MTAPTIATSASSRRHRRAVRLCPKHDLPLDGGPTWFTCPTGHGVPAADLSREFRPSQAVTS